MTADEQAQLVDVLNTMARNQELQLEALQVLVEVITAHDIRDPDRVRILEIIRTAASLDDPDAWHSALISIEHILTRVRNPEDDRRESS